MSGARLHLRRDAEDRAELGAAACGRPAVLLVEPEAVNCAPCLRIRDARAKVDPGCTWEDVVRAVAHAIRGVGEPAPALTPDAWREMACRRGTLDDDEDGKRLAPFRLTPAAWRALGCPAGQLRCRCAVCRHEEDSAAARAIWESEQQLRPHRTYGHEFGGLDAALTIAHRARTEGWDVRSSLGSMQSRALETMRLGADVQTTRRADRESLEVRRAGYAIDVEHAIARAFVEAAERRGLTSAQCIEIVLSTVAGGTAAIWAERTGVSVQAIRALIRHGRRVAHVELAVAGYVPPPRERTGLLPLIERRRAEVAR